jgi:hypothetical protein
MVVVLVQLSLEAWLWFIVAAVATVLIYRGVNVIAVIAVGALVGLLAVLV